MTDFTASPTPKHFWVIGIVATLWNAMGTFDYFMTQTRNTEYMAQFSEQKLDYFYNLPFWAHSAWAIAVWGGLLASILLLARKAVSVYLFLASLVCALFTSLYNYGLSNGLEILGSSGLIFAVVIWLIALFLYIYALSMKKRGVLS